MMAVLAPIPDYNFDKNFTDVANSSLNLSNMSAAAITPYTDIFGSIFWGIVFSLIFVGMWIRMEDITIPSLLGLLIGTTIWTMMPADWVSMAASLMVVSFAGLIYSIMKART